MSSVSEIELEQKTSDYIQFVKDFASNRNKDFILKDKRGEFMFSLFDNDATLEFTV